MEKDIVEDIVRECNLEEKNDKYIKLLIKICKDNCVGIEKIREFYT